MKAIKPECHSSGATTRKRVLLVDDHPLMREAVGALIAGSHDLTVAGEAGSAGEALQMLKSVGPDLILLDLSLPDVNGIELIKDVRARAPHIRTLVLSMHEEAIYAERILRAGAQGYLMKHQPGGVVLDAIRRVLGGEIYVSQALASKMVQQMVAGRGISDNKSGVERLSDRELSVFTELGKGLSSAEIAAKMFLSIKTVQTYRQNIKHKLGLRHSGDLVRHATEWQLNESAPFSVP